MFSACDRGKTHSARFFSPCLACANTLNRFSPHPVRHCFFRAYVYCLDVGSQSRAPILTAQSINTHHVRNCIKSDLVCTFPRRGEFFFSQLICRAGIYIYSVCVICSNIGWVKLTKNFPMVKYSLKAVSAAAMRAKWKGEWRRGTRSTFSGSLNSSSHSLMKDRRASAKFRLRLKIFRARSLALRTWGSARQSLGEYLIFAMDLDFWTAILVQFYFRF